MLKWSSWPEGVRQPTTFEIVWGFAIPLFALIFDPLIFRDQTTFAGSGGPGLFEDYRVGGYLALGGSILAFAIIVLRPPHRPGLLTLASGLLWGAAAVSLGFGLVLAPFSLIGLMFVIGILGVIPFLAAVVVADLDHGRQPMAQQPHGDARVGHGGQKRDNAQDADHKYEADQAKRGQGQAKA